MDAILTGSGLPQPVRSNPRATDEGTPCIRDAPATLLKTIWTDNM